MSNANFMIHDGDALKEELAIYVAEAAKAKTEEGGRFVVALSGGSLPKMLHFLAQRADVDWASWDVFFADERCVPLDSDDSNHKACTEHFFSKLPAQPTVHALDVSKPPAEAAEAYEAAFAKCGGVFDLVLLGMGPDGHTASLFPGHAEMDRADGALCAAVLDSPKPPPQRVTFTRKALCGARRVAYVAAGASKAPVVAEIFAWNPPSIPEKLNAFGYAEPTAPYPAAHVRAANGGATWFLDNAAAAKMLEKENLPRNGQLGPKRI